MLTSKERINLALNHQEPDRVPLDIGGINNTCMHLEIEKKVKQALSLEDHGYLIKSTVQKVVVPDQSIVDHFGVDTCSIYFNETRPWIENEDGTFTDMWGLTHKINPDGYYYNTVAHPLAEIDTLEGLSRCQFPKPTEYMVEGLRERIEANNDKFCILEGFREPMVGLPANLRRNDNFYVDLIANPEFCDALHEKILDYYIKLIDFMMERVGDGIDIVKVADDMGAQNALLFSPRTYRKMIKPWQKKLYEHIKVKHGKRILLHSCGSIYPIIGDLIEIGVDALNPVQISANKMAPEDLKREFGKDITFWGGGIDTQKVLPYSTPDEINREVKKNMEIFKTGGGFVFAPVHNVQPNVPVENVLAMYDAYREYSAYEH